MSTTLSTFDLVMTSFSAVVLPVIVYLNIRQRENPSTPFAAHMWRNEPRATIAGLVFLSILALFSMLDLAVHFGIVAPAASEIAGRVLAIPAALLALYIMVFAIRAVYLAVRSRA